MAKQNRKVKINLGLTSKNKILHDIVLFLTQIRLLRIYFFLEISKSENVQPD